MFSGAPDLVQRMTLQPNYFTGLMPSEIQQSAANKDYNDASEGGTVGSGVFLR